MGTIPTKNGGFNIFPEFVQIVILRTIQEKKDGQHPVRITLIKLDDKVIRHIVLQNGTIIESGFQNDY